MTRQPARIKHDAVRRLVRALAALIALLALTVGVPVTLSLAAGPPWPARLPTAAEVSSLLTTPDDGTLLVGALTLLSWAAWGSFVWTVVAEIAGRIRGGGRVRQLSGFRPMRRLAAGLVVSLFLTATAPTVAALAAPPPPVVAEAPPHPLARASTGDGDRLEIVPAFAPEEAAVEARGERDHESRPTYRVRRGDTLSRIAERRLGSASRWPKIWKLNAHRRQADGRLFRSPHRIYPGWRLRLPGRTPSEKPARRKETSAPSSFVRPRTTTAPQQIVVVPSAAVTPASPDTPGNAASQPQNLAGRGAPDRPVSDTVAQAVITIELPSGSVVGPAFAAGVGSALAAARLRRRKRRVIPEPANGVAVVSDPSAGDSVETLHRAHIKHAYTDQGRQTPDDAELVKAAFRIDIPTTAIIGEREDGTAVSVPLHGLDLSLTGPGAEDTARAIVLELLTRADHYRAQVIISEQDANALLGPDAGRWRAAEGCLSGLAIASSNDKVRRRFEDEFRTRARMVSENDAEDVLDLLSADPGEVLPTTVLLIGDNGADAARQRALPAGELACHGLGLLTLGGHDAGTTCQVEASGTVSQATGQLAPDLVGTRLFHVAQDDAPDILRILANSAGINDVDEPRPATSRNTRRGTSFRLNGRPIGSRHPYGCSSSAFPSWK